MFAGRLGLDVRHCAHKTRSDTGLEARRVGAEAFLHYCKTHDNAVSLGLWWSVNSNVLLGNCGYRLDEAF